MAAEARAGRERAFKIDEVAGLFLAEIGAAESFAGEVGGEMVRVEFDDGEAAAVDGDAVAEFGALGNRGVGRGGTVCGGVGETDAEAATAVGVVEGFDFSYLFGDAGEHFCFIPLNDFSASYLG